MDLTTVLVTGGGGFIGHHIALHLKERGYEVLSVDNLSRVGVESVKLLKRQGIMLKNVDVLSRGFKYVVREFRPEAMVHAAALVSVEESLKKPVLYHRVNATGTLYTLKASVEHDVKHYVYLSSAAVYGDPRYLPIDEHHPTVPKSPYGASKLAGEAYVNAFRAYGLKATILRLFNVYGPGQRFEYAGVVLSFLERVRREESPVLFGDGEQTRDFVHVLDVVEAVEAVLKKGCEGVFNIGSGKPTSIRRLAETVLELKGLDIKPIYAPPRPVDIRHSYADISRAAGELKWRPRVELRDGLKSLLEQA